MDTSPTLGLPLLATQQAQAEILHNESMMMLQALTIGAISRGLNTPPGSPVEGDTYIIGPSPTGAWAGHANKVVIRFGGSWRFVPGVDSNGAPIAMGTAQAGINVYVRNELTLYYWSGTAWVNVGVDNEQVRDVIAAALVGGTGITVTPNDPADTITVSMAATPPRLDNLISMDRNFWNTDNAAPVSFYNTDGFGFLWTLNATAQSRNWYTDFIDVVPALGFSAACDVFANISAGTFRFEVFGYTAAGASFGSVSTLATVTSTSSGWQRLEVFISPSFLAANPTLSKVRVLFQTVSVTGSGVKMTNIQANHGVRPAFVPQAPFVLPSFITPERCDARRDGITDDTAAWQTAVRDGRPVEIDASGPNGFGYKVGSITLDQPVHITFNGGRNGNINGCKLFASGSSPTFDIRSSDVTIEGNWYVDCDPYRATIPSDTPIFSVNMTAGSRENLRIEGMTAYRAGGLFHTVPGATSNVLAFTRLRRWKTFGQRGRGLHLPNVYSSFWMDDCFMEWLSSTLLPGDAASDHNYVMCNIPGNSLAGAGGIFMNKVYFQGSNRSDTPNNHGIIFDGTTGGGSGLRMQGVDVDGAGGIGAQFIKVAEIFGDDVHINSCWGAYGLLATEVANMQLKGLRSNGRKELNPGITGTIGVMLNGTDRVNLDGVVGNYTGVGLGTNGTPYFRGNQVNLVVYNCGGTGVKNAYTSLPLTSGQFIDVPNGNRIAVNGVSI